MPAPRAHLRAIAASALLATIALGSCIDPGEPGTLVPPTVVDDPALPSATIEVRGKQRRIHLRTYGDPAAPPLLIVHGSAADMRAYLGLSALADSYHVVFWDLRGNGLSERVAARELDFAVMADEIEAVRQEVAGGRRVSIIGHSWGATFVALYVAAHPDAVDQVVLIEPPGLKAEFQNRVGQEVDLLAPGYLDMVYDTELLAPVDHETLDYRTLAMLRSGVRKFSCDEDHPPPWPVWRPGGLALLVWETSLLDGSSYVYDFTPGLAAFDGEVLIVGTECSPIGSDFQRDTNLTVFRHAQLLHVAGAGHRVITEKPALLLAGLRAFLKPRSEP